MSAPTSDVGGVNSTPAQASLMESIATTMLKPANWLASLNPFTGESFLPNAALVVVGVVLALGALLISQKETIVKVGETAARVAA